MRWILRRLRGRVGVAVVLALVVLAAVGLGRVLGARSAGSDAGLSTIATGETRTPAIDTSDPDDGVEGLPTAAPASPSLSPGAAGPLVVARAFLDAWLRRELPAQQWHTGVSRHATDELSQKLSGVDPAGVPAQRLTSGPDLVPRGSGSAAVTVRVDSGRVELRLVVAGGQWRVDGVSWSRG